MTRADKKLGRRLILDELFDFTLYKRLLEIEKGELAKLLAELVPTEEKHYRFWQKFFDLKIVKLNWPRKLKLRLIVLGRRLLGEKIYPFGFGIDRNLRRQKISVGLGELQKHAVGSGDQRSAGRRASARRRFGFPFHRKEN